MYNIEYHNFLDVSKKTNDLLAESSSSIINSINSGDSYYQIFKKQDSEKITEPLKNIANRIKDGFTDVVVVSIGGASLNPQMLVHLLETRDNNLPKIHFLNNTDPIFFDELILSIDLSKTACIAISNSGQTLETNALVGCMIAEYQKRNINDLAKRCFFITNLKNGVLKDIALKMGGTLIPHQEGISGRYAGFSSVSLLIGLIAGIDVDEYIEGANAVIDDFYYNLAESRPARAAGNIYEASKDILVNIGYLQNLSPFLEWYSQIIAESLGKNGKGYTPLRGLGPNDQHSMLQLYLDGPQNKMFSLFYVNEMEQELNDYYVAELVQDKSLANKKLSELNLINYRATLMALKEKGLPVRSVMLDKLSARSFGAMVCHLMLEVVIIGNLLSINSFDQPGVELIKRFSRELASKTS